MILNAPFNPPTPLPSQAEGRTDFGTTAQSDGADTTTPAKADLPDIHSSPLTIHNSSASDQDIKILSQHFKGARTPKVQSIAEALVALGQAAQLGKQERGKLYDTIQP